MLFNFTYLLTKSLDLAGGEGAAEVAVEQAAPQVTDNATASFMDFGSGGFTMILIYVLIIGAMWFFMIRPQKKREKEIREMQASIKTGDSVITSSGFYGKVLSVGEDCFVIEFGTNKGVKIPVRKADIIGIKTPNMGSTSTE